MNAHSYEQQPQTITPGRRKVLVLFLSEKGFFSALSKPIEFEVEEGHTAIRVSDIPIGPEETKARYIAFTIAKGNIFFTIPRAVVCEEAASDATVIDDNVQTEAIFRFNDIMLLQSMHIDYPKLELVNFIAEESVSS